MSLAATGAEAAVPPAVIEAAIDRVAGMLLAARSPEGIWRGHLSSSALATATAVSALVSAGEAADAARIAAGAAWLASDQNADGGWGDSPESPSNLSTTLLVLAALRLVCKKKEYELRRREEQPSEATAGATTETQRHGGAPGISSAPPCLRASSEAGGSFGRCEGAHQAVVARGLAWVEARAGTTPKQWQAALRKVYGRDRTFAVPILMNLAIAGWVPWRLVPHLPFAAAALPPRLYPLLHLGVVSYALPALIAIGARVAQERGRGRGLLSRWMRPRAMARLPGLQPAHGGFLDAIPLTSFVAMALAGLEDRPGEVMAKCLGFLRSRQREDGSWPIDTDLCVWLTTAAVEALASAGRLQDADVPRLCEYLLGQQHRELHPYTQAAPGGWAWTDLPGGVPDADDTSGAVVALWRLTEEETRHEDTEARRHEVVASQEARSGEISCSGGNGVACGHLAGDPGREQSVSIANHKSQIANGIAWLLSLQNRNGGFPTFCRGWGKLPFDHSAPEITAHAVRALVAARAMGISVDEAALRRAVRFLEDTQERGGYWRPLWFGSQLTAGHVNATVGAARVLRGLEALGPAAPGYLARRAVKCLVDSQQSDGGWGAGGVAAATVEETALAVSALAGWGAEPGAEAAVQTGLKYLLRAMAAGALETPAPIGLYFASLWYSEKLYPLIWTLEALGRAREVSTKSEQREL